MTKTDYVKEINKQKEVISGATAKLGDKKKQMLAEADSLEKQADALKVAASKI